MNISDQRVLFIMSEYTNLLKPIPYKDEKGRFAGNTGNWVYRIAGMSYFYSEKLCVVFETLENIESMLEKDPFWGKKNFDLCIIMEANGFSEVFHAYVKEKFQKISKLGLPIFVLGAGVQSTVDYSEDFLTREVIEDTKYVIDLILSSGGDITLRGDFTGQMLAKIGYPNLFVSGCPSLYLRGESFKIEKKTVAEEEFCPMLVSSDGIGTENAKILNMYSRSVFFAQDTYMPFLYEPEAVTDCWQYLQPTRKLYAAGRISGDVNYISWCHQITEGGFHMAYGNRVHGNIIALQNGIPAYINAKDSRTREIAEFYAIPNSVNDPYNSQQETLYELYERLDYAKFNQAYSMRYQEFDRYLNRKNLPNVLGANSELLNYLEGLSYYDYRKDASLEAGKKRLLAKLPKTSLAQGRIIVKHYVDAVKWKLTH